MGLNSIHYTDIAYSFIAIGLGFFIELIFVGWKNSSLKRMVTFDKSIQTDIISSLLSIFNFFKILSFLFSFGVCFCLVGLIQKNFHLNLVLHIDGLYLQMLIVFIVSDFKEYIRHIAFHRFKPLWKLHEFHHSATGFSMITSYRGHFLEHSIAAFFKVIPYVVLGAPLHSYIIISSFIKIHHLLVHSSIKTDWGFIGKYILASPDSHKIHHSIKPEHYDKNFGDTLIIWDKIFGTFQPSEQVNEIGIPENPYNKKGYVVDVFICVKRFLDSSKQNILQYIKPA